MTSVHISLHAFFYTKPGEVFSLDVNPRWHWRRLASKPLMPRALGPISPSAVALQSLKVSNSLPRRVLQQWACHVVRYGYYSINDIFHVVDVDGFYSDALRKKFDRCPRASRWVLRWWHPELTIKQMRGVLEEMTHGFSGVAFNFWHNNRHLNMGTDANVWVIAPQ